MAVLGDAVRSTAGTGGLPGRRPLVVVALVAGIFAMHALSIGHPPAADGPTASSAAMPVMGIHGSGHGTSQEDPASPPAGGHVLDLCVAVLLVGALAWLVVARRPVGRQVLPADGGGTATPTVSWWQPPPPSLSKLCVLRT